MGTGSRDGAGARCHSKDVSVEDYLVVGRIVRPHGLKGEVAVEPRTDEPDRRFAVGALLGTQRNRPGTRDGGSLTVRAMRWHSGRLLVTFGEIADRTAAEEARGTVLVVPVDPDESPEDPDEFYDHQLIGLAVEDADGARLGTVTAVAHGGGQDLLHIDVDGAEVLYPFVAALVPLVDVSGGRIVVDDRPGLLRPDAS
jgi:16S rRNA processing protein RimM